MSEHLSARNHFPAETLMPPAQPRRGQLVVLSVLASPSPKGAHLSQTSGAVPERHDRQPISHG